MSKCCARLLTWYVCRAVWSRSLLVCWWHENLRQLSPEQSCISLGSSLADSHKHWCVSRRSSRSSSWNSCGVDRPATRHIAQFHYDSSSTAFLWPFCGTAAAAPPPFRLGDHALCGSRLLLLLCLSTPAEAQAADDTPPLRPILCLALCFAPAQFHASFSTVLFHVFLGLPLSRQPWWVHLRAFFVIGLLLPAFLIVYPIQVHFLRVIVVSMESCSAMFHNSLLVT